MRIGIDGRKIADFGIGTYIRGLLGGLSKVDSDDQYVVFAPASARELIPEGFEHVVVETPHYSVRELFVMGRAIGRASIDLFHATHYVVPFTRRPVVVTIHDLIHLHQPHRNPLARIYARVMIGRAVRKSRRIVTVSEAVKSEIVSAFACPAEKVMVTPNGVDDRFRVTAPGGVTTRYFLYAGNDKPHKNVDRLVEAFGHTRQQQPEMTLILAGADFARHQSRDGVVTSGFVSVDELVWLYRHATAVIVPSLEEGFGLPAAEAMAAGAAVITSNAAALVEVTGEAAIHVDALSVDAIAEAMLRVAGDEWLRLQLARAGIERARGLTWLRCAESTRQAYIEA